ncbi:MAG: 16S rRNA (guanine(966)-N(2))-methyltransferase RsmD [Clostridiales bacterium]|nr:16S rRNA (guanine(966)-N(2))-methyltransferase RsmD [Clostridiales bacterium]
MRVITGTARGRTLKTLPGDDVRPTSEKVKEALFSAIQFELEGRRVLDLFGGSGQLGIEALSRGAKKAVFIDSSSQSISVIRENLNSAKLGDRAVVIQTDALSFVKTCVEKFDVAFVDPPYKDGLIQKVLPYLVAKMSDGGVIVCESPTDEQLQPEIPPYGIYREYKYGKTKITLYRPRSEQI